MPLLYSDKKLVSRNAKHLCDCLEFQIRHKAVSTLNALHRVLIELNALQRQPVRWLSGSDFVGGIHPFLFVLPKRKRAVDGPKERRWRKLARACKFA